MEESLMNKSRIDEKKVRVTLWHSFFAINRLKKLKKKQCMCRSRITQMWKRQRWCNALNWQKCVRNFWQFGGTYVWMSTINSRASMCTDTPPMRNARYSWSYSSVSLTTYWTTLVLYLSETGMGRKTYFCCSGAIRNGQFCVSIQWFACTIWHK